MSESRFPADWDAERVKQLVDYHEGLSEDEQVAEDESGAAEREGQTVITVPEEVLPAIRRLLAGHKTAGPGAAPSGEAKLRPGGPVR
jgi:hypothetical protein